MLAKARPSDEPIATPSIFLSMVLSKLNSTVLVALCNSSITLTQNVQVSRAGHRQNGTQWNFRLRVLGSPYIRGFWEPVGRIDR